jgi:hypothetical protein
VRDGYAPSTLEKRIGGITHFLYWFKRKGRRVCSIKTHVVEQFMVGHLARCRCAQLCVYNARTMRLALDVLLRILRRRGQKVDPRVPRSGVKAELSAYDTYLTDVSGLTSDTRRSYLGEVENFLSRQFGTGKVDIAILAPEAVRRFIKEMSSRRLHLHHIVVALRNYFVSRRQACVKSQFFVVNVSAPINLIGANDDDEQDVDGSQSGGGGEALPAVA